MKQFTIALQKGLSAVETADRACRRFLNPVSSTKYGGLRMLLLIMFFGALIRLWCLWMEPTLSRDAMYYLKCAELLRTGGMDAVMDEYPRFQTPLLYLYSINFLKRFSLSGESAALWISMLCGIAFTGLLYGCAKLMFSSRIAGFAAAAFAATHPCLVEFSKSALRESQMIFLLGCVLLCACYSERKGRVLPWAACGFFTILSVFSRYECIELFPMAAGYLLYLLLSAPGEWRKTFQKGLLFFSGLVFGFMLLYVWFGQDLSYYQTFYIDT